MPDRVIRDALFSSRRWCQLTSAEAQLLFVRIVVRAADDFGVLDGRAEVIANLCFPAGMLDDEEMDRLRVMLRELQRVGLLIRFSNAGRAYYAIQQWTGPYRLKRKFPAPPLDVDLPQYDDEGKLKRPRTPFGRGKVQWRNPPGHDDISVLLDLDDKPVVPQPPEWRAVTSDYSPVTEGMQSHATVTVASDDAPVTTPPPTPPPPVTVRVVPVPEQGKGPVTEAEAVKVPVTGAQSLQDEALVDFNGHDFIGLSEAQRLRWQDMFAQLAIPDEVARAAAWLQAHADEREAIRKSGSGFGGFLIRWMLRSARASHSP